MSGVRFTLPDLDPAGWSIETEPMTAAQAARLRHLCAARGTPFTPRLTRREARQHIAALQEPAAPLREQGDGSTAADITGNQPEKA